MSDVIEFRVNGEPVRLETDGTRKLLWALRIDLDKTGTKYGCGQGLCGACTVLINGHAMRSCVMSLQAVAGSEVTTIEGVADGERLHPLQEEFAERGALQCGFCTPGMILGAWELLARNPAPGRSDIVAALDNNLCRCGAHKRILEAVEAVAARAGQNGGDR